MSFLIPSFLSRFWETLLQSLGLAGKKGSLVLLGLDNAGKTTLLHKLRTDAVGTTFPPTDRPSQNSFVLEGVQFTAWDLGGHEVVRHLWQDYATTNNDATSANDGAACRTISAILFLIDASDSERIEEAAYELDHLIHETLLQEQNNDEDGVPTTTKAKTTSMAIQTGQDDDDGNNDDDLVDVYSNGNGHATTTSTSTSSNIPPIAILLNKCDLESTALSTDEICRRIEFDSLQKKMTEHQAEIRVFRISVLRGEGYQQAFQWIASSFL